MIAFTEKGREIVESLKDVTLIEHPFEIVAEGQMKKNAKAKEMRRFIIPLLRSRVQMKGYLWRLMINVQRCINKIKSLI